MIHAHFFNIPVAEREGVVEPDAVADNLGGEAVAFVGVWGAVSHKSSISKPAPYRQLSPS